jgi:hypothetical protein
VSEVRMAYTNATIWAIHAVRTGGHLIYPAHYAAHTKADEWSRADEILVVLTLCALLVARKP